MAKKKTSEAPAAPKKAASTSIMIRFTPEDLANVEALRVAYRDTSVAATVRRALELAGQVALAARDCERKTLAKVAKANPAKIQD